MDFEQLKLMPQLLRAVQQAGYTQPSPIQQKAIPPVLAGRDLLGCAQTGTGKTAAFALPILQRLAGAGAPAKRRPIRALVLTPTRELALQIQESFVAYGRNLPLRTTVIFGGVGQGPQVSALQKGVDILVATPGRLNDLINQGHIDLAQVEIFVLDEADRMLDMGFVHDVKKVLARLPQQKQTLLFSATMPDEIVQLANGLLHEPARVFVTPQATTVERIRQQLYKVDKANKRHLLAQLLQAEDVGSALVFTRTKHGADRVVRELGRAGVKAAAIHGNKSQNARQDALARFKDGRVKVLVATDIAARGIDIHELSYVFNYDLPNVPETYVHRIGRTGRAGHGGTAISFCCYDELPLLADIQKLIGMKLPEQRSHDWPMQQTEAAQPPENDRQPRKKATQPAAASKKKEMEKNMSRKRTNKASAAQSAEGRQPAQSQQQKPAQQAKKAPQQGAGNQKNRRGGKNTPRPAENPYENRTGAGAIITKKPAWAAGAPEGGAADKQPPAKNAAQAGGQPAQKSGRNRGGRNRGRKRGAQPETTPQAEPATKPADNSRGSGQSGGSAPSQSGGQVNSKGIFNFSDEELAQDTSLRLVNRNGGDIKYASFEEFLKDHES